MQSSTLQFPSKKILVVEDTSHHRLFIKKAFRGIDAELTFVHDGKEAIEYLMENNPDIVLLDWNLPYFDGGEVLSAIKDNDKKISPIFIVITTSRNKPDQIRAYINGASAYIKKPSSLTGFRRVAKNVYNFWFDEYTILPDGTWKE